MARMDPRLLAGIEAGARDSKLDATDAVTMVMLLARRRRVARADETDAEALEFAGTVMCFMFDPVKSEHPRYVRQMGDTRQSFAGIYTDLALQRRFEEQLSDTLLQSGSAAAAIEAGVDALFAPQYLSAR